MFGVIFKDAASEKHRDEGDVTGIGDESTCDMKGPPFPSGGPSIFSPPFRMGLVVGCSCRA